MSIKKAFRLLERANAAAARLRSYEHLEDDLAHLVVLKPVTENLERELEPQLDRLISTLQSVTETLETRVQQYVVIEEDLKLLNEGLRRYLVLFQMKGLVQAEKKGKQVGVAELSKALMRQDSAVVAARRELKKRSRALRKSLPKVIVPARIEETFQFEDLIYVSDRDLRRVLSRVAIADLVTALKTAPQEVVDKFARSVASARWEQVLKLLSVSRPLRLSAVDVAQRSILERVRSQSGRRK